MSSTLHRGRRNHCMWPENRAGWPGLERSAAPDRSTSPLRRAFTLVEMLVAMALTLILVYAIAEFYAYVGDTVRDGRAGIEMGGSLRAATQRLQQDLSMVTVPVVPWTDDGAAQGYFEIKEGPANDMDPEGNGIDTDGDSILDLIEDNGGTGSVPDVVENEVATNLVGDTDDIIAFTINSGDQPLRGRYVNQSSGVSSIESSRQAEVIWWVGFNDTDSDGVADANEARYLFRRQLLIAPQLYAANSGKISGPHANATVALSDFWQNNDISARAVLDISTGQYDLYANSLADLSQRENRFAHNQSYPGLLNVQYDGSSNATPWLHSRYVLTTNEGDDIMLSNLLGFDVRVYDPEVQLFGEDVRANNPNLALQPGDPDFASKASIADATTRQNYVVGTGAYVDLYFYDLYNNRSSGSRQFTVVPTGQFANAPHVDSSLVPTGTTRNYGATYDTWSLSYERTQGNGKAFNGLDDDGANGVDDINERETSPPYPHPLRSVQVRIRIYEPTSRQVRQATVVNDFINQ